MEIAARAGHRGLVYLDTAQNDVYGLAPTSPRECRVWPRRAIVISDAVAPLLRNTS
jgi:hypothetical protein